MRSDTTTIASLQDSVPLFVRTWLPDGEPKGVVQAAHGMSEHSGRYGRFARALTEAGYAVWMHDHRGHGETSSLPGEAGYFTDEHGWDTAVEDMYTITEAIKVAHPGLPILFFGHSMGSMLGRYLVARHGNEFAGAVFSGTSGDQGLLGRVGELLAQAESRLRGRRARSPLMDTLIFGGYNRQFKPTDTDFDWLSRDPEEVALYVADPRCGEVMKAGFYADLLGGINGLPRLAASTPVDLPILLTSGEEDPVGGHGKWVRQVGDELSAAGVHDVSVTLYPGARHEILNEVGRDEIVADIIEWLDGHLPA